MKTKGPWQPSRFVDRSDYSGMSPKWRDARAAEEARIVRGPGDVGNPGCNMVAIANNPEDVPLLAAAPTLLEAAKYALHEIRFRKDLHDRLTNTVNALAGAIELAEKEAGP